jgi:hypothetical protein
MLMDADSLNRAKMKAEAALIESTSLLYVMLESEVTDLTDLKTLRQIALASARAKGLLKPVDLVTPTIAEELHKAAPSAGSVKVAASVDVIVNGDNHLEIPEQEEGEEVQ